MKSRLRFGASALCASEGQKEVASAISRPSRYFTKVVFQVTFDVSTVRGPSVMPHPSGGTDRLWRGGHGRFLSVFCPDDLAHAFGGESGVLVSEFNPHG